MENYHKSSIRLQSNIQLENLLLMVIRFCSLSGITNICHCFYLFRNVDEKIVCISSVCASSDIMFSTQTQKTRRANDKPHTEQCIQSHLNGTRSESIFSITSKYDWLHFFVGFSPIWRAWLVFSSFNIDTNAPFFVNGRGFLCGHSPQHIKSHYTNIKIKITWNCWEYTAKSDVAQPPSTDTRLNEKATLSRCCNRMPKFVCNYAQQRMQIERFTIKHHSPLLVICIQWYSYTQAGHPRNTESKGRRDRRTTRKKNPL